MHPQQFNAALDKIYVHTATVGKYNIQGICVRMHKNILLQFAESTSITAYRFAIGGKDSEA